MLRKVGIGLAGVLAMGGVAVGAALAQSSSPTVIHVHATVKPNRAGTRRHPRGVKLSMAVHWRTPAQFERPVVQKGVVLFPKGSLYNGRKYPRCSERRLNRAGLSGCPRRSIMGHGTGVAYADTVITKPKITVVNGGSRHVCLYTVLNNPARVQACVPGYVRRLHHGRWAYRLTLKVPQVLQVVAGVPIQLRDLHVTAGRGKWLATTACHHHRWRYRVTTFYSTGGSSSARSSVRCRR